MKGGLGNGTSTDTETPVYIAKQEYLMWVTSEVFHVRNITKSIVKIKVCCNGIGLWVRPLTSSKCRNGPMPHLA